ncbi:MAG: RDD family protein [Anaerolineae bacterium]|nr:RDD family protein [Anaerolineae bacterium]
MSRLPLDNSKPDLLGQYAGFATRLIAFATDQLLVIGIIVVVNSIVMLVLSFFQVTVADVFSFSGGRSTLAQWMRVLFLALGLLLNVSFYVGYFIFFWMLVGQTPGKMLMGVRVVSVDARPLSFGQAIKRLLGYYLSMLPFFIGFFWILVSDSRQGWHDKIARTYVIYTWRAAPSLRFWRRLSRAAEKRAAAHENKNG